MNIHANARLTPLRREEMARIVMDRRGTQKEAAILYGVSVRTVAKWVKRFRQAGPVAMQDRSSKPHHSALAIAKRSASSKQPSMNGFMPRPIKTPIKENIT